MDLRYDDPKPLAPREERGTIPAQKMGIPIVAPQYRYVQTITPAAGILAQPIDAFIATTDGAVSVVGADDAAATAVAIPVKAGVLYPIACSRVTASTAGVVIGLTHRKTSDP